MDARELPMPVRQLLERHSPELPPDVESAALLQDVGIDSLELLSLAADCERSFSVVITDDQLSALRTVADLTRLLSSPPAASS